MLTEQHIDAIAALVCAEVHHSRLREELTEHLCCAVEDLLMQGHSFEAALKQARHATCPEGPAFIEAELNRTIFNPIPPMKKSFHLVAVITTMLFTFGILFKVQHWPGATILNLLTALLLVFGLIPLLFANLYQAGIRKTLEEKIKQCAGAAGFMLIAAGITFKVQHWPGADLLLMLGVMALNLGYFPMVLFRIFKNPTQQPGAEKSF
jgi:hypothetical protein